MDNNGKMPVPDFLDMVEKLKKKFVTRAKREGTKFFKGRFREQAWHDNVREPWTQRISDSGRAILVGRGYLRDSIRVIHANDKYIRFGTDARYAKIHNEGGTIRVRVTARSKKFFWYMYMKTDDAKWKYMAFSKKTHFDVHIPKRQFIGHSDKLMKELDDWAISEIEKTFKKTVNDA